MLLENDVMIMIKILVVEDEKPINELIVKNLTKAGYECIPAYDGQEAADKIENNDYDLVILDIMLPSIDGYELLEYIKPIGKPVIFLTAKSLVKDRVKGLNMGAEDYIIKPFDITELIARIEVVLRRFHKTSSEIYFQEFKIDLENHIVYRKQDIMELTPKEFALFAMLVRNKNQTLYREQLYMQVWEEEYSGNSRTLDIHIRRLRGKLGIEERLKTVFKLGYRLEEIP